MLVIYGAMGGAGIHLDIGTSMLASLIIGAGVDYAVHFLSAWYAEEGEDLQWAAARASVRVGPAIWTNALMVAVGFFVLTLGEARPLKNVGGLTAGAMIVAALVTFLVVPVLAGRRSYKLGCAQADPADGQLAQLRARLSKAP
jgi:predicted RND superfamily exporter protein